MIINPTKIDVLFFIEHIDREMETAQEIVSVLKEKYNLKCVIASAIYHPVTCALKTRPKIIVTASTAFGIGSPGWLFFKSFKNAPIFINLNYEQFISSWKGKYKSAKHDISLKSQIQLTWGTYFKNFLIETGTKKENIIVTGRPLFSLLKKRYYNKNFKKDIAKKNNLDFNKKWNFIAFTDGLAFVTEKKIQYIVQSGANEKGLKNHINHVKGTISEVLKWVNSMSAMSDELFILRPHPSISKDQYEELIKSTLGLMPENLIISKDYTAQKWMISCERFFTNYSTLTMDARVLEKDFYILSPLKKLESEDYWWCNNGFSIESYDDFKNLILKNDLVKLNTYASKENILDYIDLSKDGIKETSSTIFKMLIQNNIYPKVSYYRFINSILKSPKRLLGSLLRLIFMSLRINSNSIVRKGIAIDYFNYKKLNNDL